MHDLALARQVYGTDDLTESQIAAIRSPDRWGMAMRHAIKPVKVKPPKPKPPASAFHQ